MKKEFNQPEVAIASFASKDQFLETKSILNQAVADLYTARIVFHQIHWYMRGRGFMVWHPKMDEFMDSLDEQMDEISERLITLGGAPYSTLEEFVNHTNIKEETGNFNQTIEEKLSHVLDVYRYLSELFDKGMKASDEEGDDVSNGIFSDAKADADKTVWMLTAELNQEVKIY